MNLARENWYDDVPRTWHEIAYDRALEKYGKDVTEEQIEEEYQSYWEIRMGVGVFE